MGVGATTAIFTVVRGVLLRPLPYADGERIANIWVDWASAISRCPRCRWAIIADYRARSRTFEEFAAATGGGMIGATGVLTGSGGDPEHVDVSGVSANFFPLLGVAPAFGRQFTADEESPKGPAVVILSHGLWQRRYGSDPSIVGRYIDLDGVRHLVVGVLPPFSLLLPAEAFLVKDADVWKPLQLDYTRALARNVTPLTVFGRLRPGVTMAQAQEEMSADRAQAARGTSGARGARTCASASCRSTTTSSRPRASRCVCWRWPSRCCWRSPARTSRICCSRAAADGFTRWPCAARLARADGVWRGSSRRRISCSPRSAAPPASCWRISRCACFLSLAPATLPRQASITMDMPVFVFSAIATLIAGLDLRRVPDDCERAQRERPHADADGPRRHARAWPHPPAADRRRSGAVARAARGRGTAAAQHDHAAAGASGLRCGSRDDVWRVAAAVEI